MDGLETAMPVDTISTFNKWKGGLWSEKVGLFIA